MDKLFAHSELCDSMDEDGLATGPKPCNCWVGEIEKWKQRAERAEAEARCLRNYGVTQAEALDRLRAAIEQAPHQMGCASLQGGPDTPGWASIDRCDCWKRRALEGK